MDTVGLPSCFNWICQRGSIVPEGLDSLVRNPSPLDDSQLNNRCFARFRRARGSCFELQRASFGNDERLGRSLGARASAAASRLAHSEGAKLAHDAPNRCVVSTVLHQRSSE